MIPRMLYHFLLTLRFRLCLPATIYYASAFICGYRVRVLSFYVYVCFCAPRFVLCLMMFPSRSESPVTRVPPHEACFIACTCVVLDGHFAIPPDDRLSAYKLASDVISYERTN
ncbi:hypothetical protein DENSPDRAFT_455086 [Dentipellis sp. KUC8613]|nr:hypothetical protein DENSPDRAFT_455086 [Dentipellis sp. KUC8613]